MCHITTRYESCETLKVSRSIRKYYTGTSLQLRLMRWVFSNANDINLFFLMIFPRMSLHCKLVPVQYWEYEYGLSRQYWFSIYVQKEILGLVYSHGYLFWEARGKGTLTLLLYLTLLDFPVEILFLTFFLVLRYC